MIKKDPLQDVPTIQEVLCTEVRNDQLPELQLISKDIPAEMLGYYMRKAMRRFTDRSRTQLRKVEILLQSGVCEYAISLPCGEEFLSFQNISADCRSPAETTTECGRYQVKWGVSTCNVTVFPEPCGERVPVELVVATTPSIDSCQVDSKIYRRNYDTLIHGAMSYLYAVKGDEANWADGALATYHDQKFQAGITAAATDKILGHAAGPFALVARRIM